jgi:hypothetical protein
VAALARGASVREGGQTLPYLENKTTHARRLAPDAIAIAVLALVLAFFYWGFLAGRSFIWDDTLTEFYPGANYFAASIHAGRFPLWFPGVHDGQPFYSDPQMAVFYPLQWLLIPFVQDGRLPFLAYQGYIVLHYLLGGLFLYAFLKQIRLSPVAALSGALVFCLSGFASLHLVNFVIIQVYIWLPLQLLCVDRLVSGKSRWAWFSLVGAMVLSLLAGHQQTTVYCWYLVIAYWLYRHYSMRRKDGLDWKVTARRVVSKDVPKLIGIFVLMFGLSAIMLIPAMQNWWRTARRSQSFESIADTSLPYHQLATLLVPNFFGKTQSSGSLVPFWGFDPHSLTVIRNGPVNATPGYWQYWEFGAYAGQIFWLALLLVLFNWRKLEDKQTVAFFVFVWLAAIWFMLGRYGGLFQILYHVLPGASVFRGPAKMSCVATFASAILSAYAVDLLRRRVTGLRYWPVWLPVAGCACLALALYFGGAHLAKGLRNPERLNWSQHETFFALAVSAIGAVAAVGLVRSPQRGAQSLCLGVLLFVTIADFHHAYGSFQQGNVSPDQYYPETTKLLPLLKDYREQRGPFRFGQINRGQISEEIATFRNLPYFHDFLEVPEGYTSFYLDGVAEFQAITNVEAKIAIQNIIVTMERDEAGKDWLGTRTNSFPRAKFFPRVRHYDSRAALLGALEDGQIDWRHEAAVTESDIPGLTGQDRKNDATNTDDEVHFASVSPETYSVKYHVSRPGIIFVSQAYYPGWHVINAWFQMVEVFGAFQGIVIPEAGEGEVIVRFSPPALKMGLAISLISLLIAILLAWFGRAP